MSDSLQTEHFLNLIDQQISSSLLLCVPHLKLSAIALFLLSPFNELSKCLGAKKSFMLALRGCMAASLSPRPWSLLRGDKDSGLFV